MKRLIITVAAAAACTGLMGAKSPEIAPSYAWEATMPLGTMRPAPMDTSYIDYSRQFVPSMVSSAYATTGNFGSEGMNMIWVDRQPMSDFYFVDPLTHWIPGLDTFKFYNTRIPMTLLGYSFGGGSDNSQDRLNGVFSGNVNRQIQIGAYVDYLYSKGSYDNQAVKDFTYGFSGSYIGERYKLQASIFHYNLLNKENGGITDDLYITDPAEVQGGQTSVNTKQIPTNLTNAHTRVKGLDLFVNNRYSLGYHHVERADTDTIERRTFIPVTDLIWTLQVRTNSHLFTNRDNSADTRDFWKDTYYDASGSSDRTHYTLVSNTLGIALLEGFHKWAKAGLTGFVTYEYSKFTLPEYEYYAPSQVLTPLPDYTPDGKFSYNKLYVGARLASIRGKYVNYDVTGRIGLVGAPGEFNVDGSVTGSIPLLGDTLGITGYGSVRNNACSPLMERYRSNHYIWNNDFNTTQAFRFGGILTYPRTGTTVNVGTETVTNYVFFDRHAMPAQHSGGVQLFWARLEQKLGVGPLHWDNTVTYQATTDEDVIPLPALAIYSNLYFTFRIAKVLALQAGVDCDYYTRYRAPGYQPATMAFYNEHEMLIGNYPYMNLYINMRLKRARFYVMMAHINQGMMGSNYFSMPHYPLNPRRFQLGVSVDFAN